MPAHGVAVTSPSVRSSEAGGDADPLEGHQIGEASPNRRLVAW